MKLNFTLWNTFFITFCLMLIQALFGYGLISGGILSGGFLGYFYYRKQLSVFDVIFALAYLMNVWYVISSDINVRQYDYFNFYMHADYFLSHDFFIHAPKEYLQSVYFQPPLWGLVGALVDFLMMTFSYTKEQGFDFVKYLSMFAIGGSYIIFWRLEDRFHIKTKVKQWGFAFFCFYPIHGIMANLVNNDAFVYFLMLAMMLLAYDWYNEQKWRYAFAISGLLFIAGMIKFSGLMVVPAIAIVGLFMLFFNQRKVYPKLIGQFSVIALGGVLGFSWGIFLLYYHFPLVPPPLDVEYQSMAGFSISERFLSLKNVLLPFVNPRVGAVEPNVLLTLVKTSLFGEWYWDSYFFAYVLYFLGVVSALLFAFSFFSLFFYKMGKDFVFNASMIVLVFSVFAAWINFWLDYPYFCSTEFRYTAILLPMAVLWTVNFLSQKSLPIIVYYIMAGGISIFIFSRFMLYLYTI